MVKTLNFVVKKIYMTQKEAVIAALRQLGGRAKMGDICTFARQIGDFSGSRNPNATIRNCIYTHPRDFIKSQKKDCWELVSFQEDIAVRDCRIKDLESENAKLRCVKTEDDFVKRMVRETKNLYKHENVKIEVVRQILYKLGRSDAEEELDAWIDGREYKPSVNINGDLVMNKRVQNEVGSVASDATGIIVNSDKKQTL
jgi:hypothetical protein